METKIVVTIHAEFETEKQEALFISSIANDLEDKSKTNKITYKIEGVDND